MNVTALRRDDAASTRACSVARDTGADRGAAPGFVQGNLAILLAPPASNFLRFCQLNPKPCSLIGTSAPGYPSVPEVGEDLDIRIDLPPSKCDGLDRSSFEARFARTS